MQRAVVLLSGGLDSATCTAIAKQSGYQIHAITFDYGSKHNKEIESAKRIAAHYKVNEHMIFPLAMDRIGGSALLDENADIPQTETNDTIPTTYVPARNTVFLAIGLSYAESIDAEAIFIGANAIDYSGYPDCRPEYIKAFQQVSNLGTKKGVDGKPIEIVAPLVNLSKAEIINEGMRLGVPYDATWTCYAGGEKACGKCDACSFRLKGFKEAGLVDPIQYED